MIKEAAEAYKEAVASEDAQPSHVASTRKQALQISLLYEDKSIRQKIHEVFPKFGIVACSGHLIDCPGKSRRFPQEAEEIVGPKSIINSMRFKLVADTVLQVVEPILFLEAMADRGGETHIFLPFEKDKFIETSVLREGSNWVERFEKALDHATSVHYVTNEGYYGDDTLFTFCNDVMLGFAAMRVGVCTKTPIFYFLGWQSWRGGGTGDVAQSWRKTFNDPMIICANEVLEELDQLELASIEAKPAMPSLKKSFGDSVTAMLLG